MDQFTLYTTLSSLVLTLKELVSEKREQKDGKETEWFRKSLNHKLHEIQESTGVSESILSEVLEKIDAVHSKLEQKNANQDLMIDVLKSYIDNDIKQMIEGDLCDQQKWILILASRNDKLFYMEEERGVYQPEHLDEDLRILENEGYLWRPEELFKLTRKGKEAVEKGFIFTTHWTFADLVSRKPLDLPISSSNLQILTEKKKELEKQKGQPDWSLKNLNAWDGDWLKFERPNGETRKMIVKNGVLEF